MSEWFNCGVGLYLLWVAWIMSHLEFHSITEPIPHPNWGPLPDPWIIAISPPVMAVIGVASIAVGAYNLYRKGAARRT